MIKTKNFLAQLPDNSRHPQAFSWNAELWPMPQDYSFASAHSFWPSSYCLTPKWVSTCWTIPVIGLPRARTKQLRPQMKEKRKRCQKTTQFRHSHSSIRSWTFQFQSLLFPIISHRVPRFASRMKKRGINLEADNDPGLDDLYEASPASLNLCSLGQIPFSLPTAK